MIFKQFDKTDVVEGRSTKVSSGFWPDGQTYWSTSYFESNFWDLSTTETPSTAYGSSPYDVRKTLYYTDVYPDLEHKTVHNDPYFSIAYGHIGGSGSFDFETGSIRANPTKAIYSQYKNVLLGTTDIDGKFTLSSGSTQINADDIYALNFSTYKMKDRIDEGVFELSLRAMDGSGRIVTFIDDSHWIGKIQSVYQLVTGSLNNIPKNRPDYPGIGLLYPNDGVVIFNAVALNNLLGLSRGFEPSGQGLSTAPGNTFVDSNGVTRNEVPSSSYFSGSKSNGMVGIGDYTPLNVPAESQLDANLGNQNNNQALFWSIKHSGMPMIVRKSEYVPSRHYFVRVKNRDFNYSNNPTYVYDGTEVAPDGTIYPIGTIRNQEFYNDPRTYITTVGLYNDTNELVAVAKLSRPALKTFDNELLIKIRTDW